MRVFAHPPPLLSAQALTLYTRDADGSVKAVIAAKAGGLDLTVLPIAQYTGSADASQVRIAAIASPKPRRRNPETDAETRERCPRRKCRGRKRQQAGPDRVSDAVFLFRFSFAMETVASSDDATKLVPLITSGHPVN